MKKTLILVALMGVGYASAAPIVIYDTMTGSGGWSSTGSQPRNFMADGFNAISKASNITWKVTKVEFIMYVGAATTITKPTVTFDLYNQWVPAGVSGSGSTVFADLAGERTYTWGTITTTGAAAYIMSMTLGTPIMLNNSGNIGMSFKITDNGTVNTNLAVGMRDLAPAVSGGDPSSNVFYRDANSNGIIDTTDAKSLGYTYNNLGIRLTAEAVPEPATMGALAVGLSALFLRRRRK